MVQRPSDENFNLKLQSMIRDRGIEGVARLTKKSPATVRNWAAGRTRPSAKIARSVVRQGTTDENKILRVEGEYVYKDLRTTETINKQNIKNERLQEINILEARTEKEKRLARTRNQKLTIVDIESIDQILKQKDDALEEGITEGQWWKDWRARLKEAGYNVS